MSRTFRLELPRSHDREIVAARLFAAGALGVWETPDQLVAWFSVRAPLAEDLAAVARWTDEPDRDWQAEWKATIQPVVAGRFHVVPSWLVEHTPTADNALRLVLDPGRAFGSGHHATTTLCLELLDDADRRHPFAGQTVADVGCGSGILAIAAARLGAHVTAIDIDADAITVTRENATANGVDVATVHGGVTAATGPYDLVVANLLTDVIAANAAALVAAASTTLLVSGITDARHHVALDALRDAGAEPVDVRVRDGWVAARLTTVAAP